MNNGINTKRIAADGMMAAMCAVLGFIAIDTGPVKVTFESYPVLLAGLMFGPVDGALVGGIGTLIYQVIRYGVDVTTILWMLPYIIVGFMTGAYAKKYSFRNTNRQIYFIITLSEFLILILNTAVIYIHANLYGYYTAAYVFGALGLRILICILESVVFSAITPGILSKLHRVSGNSKP